MLCPCCVHVESAEVQLSSNKKKTVHMESTWSPCGVVESTRTLWGRVKYTKDKKKKKKKQVRETWPSFIFSDFFFSHKLCLFPWIQIMLYIWNFVSAAMFAIQQLPTWIWISGALIFLPCVTASSDKAAFPDLPFKVFSKF